MKRGTILAAMVMAAPLLLTGQAAAQDRLLQRAKDTATGAWLQLYQTNSGTRVEVDSPGLTIRKEASGDTVVTDVRSGKESLVIRWEPSGMTVSSSGGHATAAVGDSAASARVKQLIAASPLAGRAAALIAKLGFAGVPMLQPVLLTTRAFLLAVADDGSGALELKEWVSSLRSRPQLVKTGGAPQTPTDCWKGYGDEVLAAFDEYWDCIQHPYWFESNLPTTRCGLVYEIRIIGASAWYVSCVSLGGLIGK